MAVATDDRKTAMATQTGERDMTYVAFGTKENVKLNVTIIRTMVCVPSRSGKLCSDIEAMKFMMLCRARALNPFDGDCFMLGYDSADGKSATFSMITAHQAFLKRAEVHPEFDGMESGVIVREQDGKIVDREGDFLFDEDFILGGWAVVHFKNRRHPMRKRLTLKVFHTGKSRWKDDPAGMIVKCAEADALRSAFPTSLGGLYLEGEMPVPFVNEAPKKAEIPAGRTKLKDMSPGNGNGHTAPVETGKTNENQPSADPSEIADDQDADSIAMNLQDAIEEATTMAGLQTVGADIKVSEAKLGPARFAAMMTAFQAKGKLVK